MSSIAQSFQLSMQYLLEALSEIFSPNHDNYPIIGIQPYEGDYCKSSAR